MQGSKWPVGARPSSPWMAAGHTLHNLRALSTTRVHLRPGAVRWQAVPIDTISIRGTGYHRLNICVPPIPQAESQPPPHGWYWVWGLWEVG